MIFLNLKKLRATFITGKTITLILFFSSKSFKGPSLGITTIALKLGLEFISLTI
jgi:hypothetical protein